MLATWAAHISLITEYPEHRITGEAVRLMDSSGLVPIERAMVQKPSQSWHGSLTFSASPTTRSSSGSSVRKTTAKRFFVQQLDMRFPYLGMTRDYFGRSQTTATGLVDRAAVPPDCWSSRSRWRSEITAGIIGSHKLNTL
jgi:hypothetical protein